MFARLLLPFLLASPAVADTADPGPADTDAEDTPTLRDLETYPTGGNTVTCQTAQGAPGGLLVGALLAAAVARRGLRRATGALIALLLVAASPVASAQTVAADGKPLFTPRLDAQRFEPCGLVSGFVTTCSARQLRQGKVSFDGIFSWGWRPVQRSERIADTLIRREGAVEHLGAAHLRLAVGATDWFQISLGGPVLQVLDAHQGLEVFAGPLGNAPVGPGDLTLDLQFAPLVERRGVGVAITPFAVFPTGSRRYMLTDGAFGIGGRVAVSGQVGAVHLAAHGGYLFRPGHDDVAGHVAVDDEVRYGAGVGFELLPETVKLDLEVLGATTVGTARLDIDHTPATEKLHTAVEATASLLITLENGFALVAGGGSGLTPAPGMPAARAFLGFSYLPAEARDRDGDGIADRHDRCVGQPEDFDGYQDDDGCPDPDDEDGDGFYGDDDRCPNDPEDFDGFEDHDGCPDLDDDRDGIPDALDTCPLDPEDFDGFEDHDGCPDFDDGIRYGAGDLDGDGIPDDRDRCPAAAEDYDGFADDDGCPDGDNDGDGIPDDRDACPDEAEVRNGFQDDDGCPDETRAKLTADRIEITERVQFYTAEARIRPESYPVLDDVAAILREYPEIRRIRIEGHTDAQGSDAYNDDLSERRALAVRQYLIDKGISPNRLLARGFGERYPIAPNSTEEGRAANRRVEFVILGPEDEGGL